MEHTVHYLPSGRRADRVLGMKTFFEHGKETGDCGRQSTRSASQQVNESQRSLSMKLLAAQEAERTRIARDLHDELGQGFAILKLNLSRLKRELPENQPQLKDRCEDSLEHINSLLEHIRRIIRDLSSSILEDLGLTVALRYLVRSFSATHAIEESHDIPELDHVLMPADQIMLYRILQEALNNVGKHARARRVGVSVRIENGFLIMTVEDDGCGFDRVAARNPERREKGIGLTTMAERANLLGGSLQIHSGQGEGTLLTVRVPVTCAPGCGGNG